jgi:hypothetical protein
MEFKRLFSRSDAESALPLVRQIVADILETAARLRAPGVEDDERERLQAALDEHLGELEEMGCFYKDWSFSTGLVDFPAVIDGKSVFLCWRSDEDRLGWYHGVEDGYRGRRPLPES